MNEKIATDSEVQVLLRGGQYFRAYCKICRKKTPLSYHNWREDVKTEIIKVINGDKNVLNALREMLQCLCEEDNLDISTCGLFDYGVKLVMVLIPVMAVLTQVFYDFSSDVANIQNNAVESVKMLNKSFQISILEEVMVLSVSLLILWGLHSIQRFFDHNSVMHKLYNKELLKILNSIDIMSDDGSSLPA